MNHWKKLLIRSAREGTLQLWRNKFLSGTTILLGALILFLMNFIFAVQFYADYSLQNLESRADFAVPLEENYEVFQFDALKNNLNNDFTVTLKVLEAENFVEFSVPTRLHIKFSKLEEVGEVFQTLKSIRYSDVIGDWDGAAERDFVTLIEKLLKVRSGIETASFWLVILFLGGGILLMVNAFRIVLFSRREEIFVARLVGAETSFIAGPFLWEGVMMGFVASFIAILSFILVLKEIDFLPGGLIFIHLWNSVFSYEILISGLVGGLGGWIAMKRYLLGKFGQ